MPKKASATFLSLNLLDISIDVDRTTWLLKQTGFGFYRCMVSEKTMLIGLNIIVSPQKDWCYI